MAAVTSTFSSYDRSVPSMSDNSTQNRQLRNNNNTNSTIIRPGQHLDDADLLTWNRQYANIGLRDDNIMSNSADNLSQLVDPLPFGFHPSDPGFNDPSDDELHFDDGNNFDYEVAIQERLKRANEEFQHDETPAELKHRQRVSFDSVVKAVDIVQEPEVDDNTNRVAKPPVSPVAEESAINATSSQNESNPHEYTVPLNDTQPKEGPTLLEQLKAMQFHGGPPAGDRRQAANTKTTNDSSTREDNESTSKVRSNDTNATQKTSDMTTKESSSPQRSMVVSINGGFEIQNEDDYTAKHLKEKRQSQSDDDDNNNKSTIKDSKVTHTSTESKQNSLKPEASRHPPASPNRPKSSDTTKRSDNNSTSKSLSYNRNNSSTNNQQRTKSATVSKSIESFINKPCSIDFDELNRKAAEKKRAEMKEERRKKEEADAKRKEELARAKEKFEQWVQDKDAERRRLNEEKRMEKEEQEARELQCQKELGELREKKYKEWIERKNREVTMANEFKKLQADEEELMSGGSSSSIHNPNKQNDHRAFRRWLRRKYEQSKEEKRQLRLETRRLRQHQRRSIKRYQLQQDLQLAKSFGYT